MNRASFIKAMGAVFLAPTAAARLAEAWAEPPLVVPPRLQVYEITVPVCQDALARAQRNFNYYASLRAEELKRAMYDIVRENGWMA